MNKQYGKLVRDNIPDIIRAQGGVPVVRILSEEEYLRCLNDKLLEEMREYLACNGCHCMEELCDIQEVLDALANALGFSHEELVWAQAEKAARNGRFRRRLYLEEVREE